MTPIQQLIQSHNGPAAFRRALEARGVRLSRSTVNAWSAPGKAHREPDAAKLEMMRRALK